MPLRAHLFYGVFAAVDIALAVGIARKMGEGEGNLGAVAVFVAFTSWALFVWLTPLGPHLWRASALGLVVVATLVVLSFAVMHGVPVFVGRSDAPREASARRTFFVRSAWLLLLLFLMPMVAHLASGGLLPAQQ